MPWLTIIVPTFNSEKTLSKALSSIIKQSFSNFEVVIIDSCSQDKTLEIISTYAEKDARIRYVSEKDKGIYDAMNKGLVMATGEWVYFLGSDDVIYQNDVLHNIYNFLLNNSFDILYGNVYSTRFNGLYDGEFSVNKILFQNICHQAIFFKKDVFNKIGKFNLRFKAHADWEHNMRWLLSKDIKSKFLDIIVANYADGGFSSVHGDEKFYAIKKLIYLKYGYKWLKFDSRLTLFRDVIYTRRHSRDLIGLIEAFRYLPYVFLPS